MGKERTLFEQAHRPPGSSRRDHGGCRHPGPPEDPVFRSLIEHFERNCTFRGIGP